MVKQKRNKKIHWSFWISLIAVVIIVVTGLLYFLFLPKIYSGEATVNPNSEYPGYKIVRMAKAEMQNDAGKPVHTCQEYSNVDNLVTISLSDLFDKPCKTILGKKICLDVPGSVKIKVHCSNWCSEFVDYAYVKSGYNLNPDRSNTKEEIIKHLNLKFEDFCSVDWNKLKISCYENTLEYFPLKDGGNIGLKAHDTLKKVFQEKYYYWENNEFNRINHPPMVGDYLYNPVHSFIMSSVVYVKNFSLFGNLNLNDAIAYQEISGNLGFPRTETCSETNPDTCSIGITSYNLVSSQIIGWGRAFSRADGSVYEVIPSSPVLSEPGLSFGNIGIAVSSFKSELIQPSSLIDRNFQNTYFPTVNLSGLDSKSSFSGTQEEFRALFGGMQKKIMSTSFARTITNKNTLTNFNPVVAKFSVNRPGGYIGTTTNLHLGASVNFADNNPKIINLGVSNDYSRCIAPNSFFPKTKKTLDSLSGTITFEKTWLEDYQIMADVSYWGGCCDGNKEIWFGNFKSQKYTVKTLSTATTNFLIPLNKDITSVENSGGHLLVLYYIIDKSGNTQLLLSRDYLFPQTNSVCSDGVNHVPGKIDLNDFYARIKNELANQHIIIPPNLDTPVLVGPFSDNNLFKKLKMNQQFYVETLNPTTGKLEVNRNVVFQFKNTPADNYKINQANPVATIGATRVIMPDNSLKTQNTIGSNLVSSIQTAVKTQTAIKTQGFRVQ